MFYRSHIIGFIGFWVFSFFHYAGLLEYCTGGECLLLVLRVQGLDFLGPLPLAWAARVWHRRCMPCLSPELYSGLQCCRVLCCRSLLLEPKPSRFSSP